MSRRSVLGVVTSILAAAAGGCLGDFGSPRRPYGDVSIRNDDDRAHRVTIEARNHHVIAREGKEAGTGHLDVVVETGAKVTESRFFEAGRTDVAVSVDDVTVGTACLSIWRGEGGDGDRHEERLDVIVDRSGETEVSVEVTNEASSIQNVDWCRNGRDR